MDCKHPHFIRLVCVCCGKTLKDCGNPPTTPFEYMVPGLSLTLPEIDRLRSIDFRNLTYGKKLHLVIDLDNTLIHAIRLNSLSKEDQYYVKAGQNLTCNWVRERYREPKSLAEDARIIEMPDKVHVLKKRLGVGLFLKELSSLFDISLYTLGGRTYAK